jgi:hypothetical protein
VLKAITASTSTQPDAVSPVASSHWPSALRPTRVRRAPGASTGAALPSSGCTCAPRIPATALMAPDDAVLAAGVGAAAGVAAGALGRDGSAPPGASRVDVIGCAAVTSGAVAGWLVAGGAGICAVTGALPAQSHQARPAAITSALAARLRQRRGADALLDKSTLDVFMACISPVLLFKIPSTARPSAYRRQAAARPSPRQSAVRSSLH